MAVALTALTRRGLTLAALGISTRAYGMQFAAPPRSLSREEVRAVDEKAIAMGLPGICLCSARERTTQPVSKKIIARPLHTIRRCSMATHVPAARSNGGRMENAALGLTDGVCEELSAMGAPSGADCCSAARALRRRCGSSCRSDREEQRELREQLPFLERSGHSATPAQRHSGTPARARSLTVPIWKPRAIILKPITSALRRCSPAEASPRAHPATIARCRPRIDRECVTTVRTCLMRAAPGICPPSPTCRSMTAFIHSSRSHAASEPSRERTGARTRCRCRTARTRGAAWFGTAGGV